VAEAAEARVTERAILFKGEMVRAILAGTKTQTRRLVGPDFAITGPNPPAPGLFDLYRTRGLGKGWCGAVALDGRGSGATLGPYGMPGDRLWVRETHGWVSGAGRRLVYRADGTPTDRFSGAPIEGMKWAPSIFMRRVDSRLLLEITDVRVQPVQAITEEDAKAEGAEGHHDVSWPGTVRDLGTMGDVRRRNFAVLWESINGERASWESNPWVWAIAFRRIA
jgi:hypothetical protein